MFGVNVKVRFKFRVICFGLLCKVRVRLKMRWFWRVRLKVWSSTKFVFPGELKISELDEKSESNFRVWLKV